MLPTVLAALLPLVLLACGFGGLFLGVLWWRRQDGRRTRRSPLVHNLLRPPGHSLRGRIDDLSLDIDVLFVVFLVAPCLLFAAHVAQSYWFGTPEYAVRIFASAGAVVVTEFWAARCLARTAAERKRLRLALEGELATAEELNQLMLDGCRVFHDLRFPYGNIDHVVVCPTGVCCINTKMRGKPQAGDDSADVTVDYERNLLKFPDGSFPIPTAQLQTEARWLAEMLSGAIGEPILVEGMLALPGWFVKKRIGRGVVPVFNPRKPQAFFLRRSGRQRLKASLMERIAYQIERLCREIEPTDRQDRAWPGTSESSRV